LETVNMTQRQGAFIQPLPELGEKLREFLPEPTADAILNIAELYVATRQSDAEDGKPLSPRDARDWIEDTMTMISRLEDRLRGMPDEVSDPMGWALSRRRLRRSDMVENAKSALRDLDNALLEADRFIEEQPRQPGHTHQCAFQRLRHVGFHLFRSQPWTLGEHNDGGLR